MYDYIESDRRGRRGPGHHDHHGHDHHRGHGRPGSRGPREWNPDRFELRSQVQKLAGTVRWLARTGDETVWKSVIEVLQEANSRLGGLLQQPAATTEEPTA